MTNVLFGAIVVNLVLFLTAFGMAARQATRATTRRMRTIAWTVGGLAAVLASGAALRLVLQADRNGWLPESVADAITPPWDVVQAVAAVAVGVIGHLVVTRIGRRMRRGERMVQVLTRRVRGATLSALHLTARELDVLECLSDGILRDEDLSAALAISPATASTHIRNILRKADLNDRRDLLLLTTSGESD